ncbi:MAG: hypothetical protein WCG80_18690 [Spirochaetales bacterium]
MNSRGTVRSIGTLFALALAALALAELSACSNSQPQIGQVFSQVNQVWSPTAKVWQPRLSVFVLVSNADGIEDIDRLHLVHDNSRLVWSLEPSQWTRIDRTGEMWLGANNLSVPGDSGPAEIPTGAWKVLVLSKAGQQAESAFVIPPPPPGNLPPRPPVRLDLPAGWSATERQGSFRLTGFASDYVVWTLGETGEVLAQKPQTSPVFSLTSLLPAATLGRVRSLMFYSYDKLAGQGLEAGPFELK